MKRECAEGRSAPKRAAAGRRPFERPRHKARRRCFTDDCADLREAVSGAIPEERIDELSRAAEETCRSSIKHDSVEMTEEYLAVIDEVEAEIDRLKTSDFCLEYWSLKSSLLAERGIVWQSPAQLNPNVMFD